MSKQQKPSNSFKKIEWKVDDNECWNCTSHAQRNHYGYPACTRNGKYQNISRHFYARYKGEIPEGLVVRHTCDNRKCINPDHLILGTHDDNMKDRSERDRCAKGESNGSSKLTPEKVANIYISDLSPDKIAKTHGVSKSHVYRIKRGEYWKHITKHL